MAANMISKYVWLLETLRRHKHLRRDEINRLWVLNESLSQGRPLSRRTLYTYMRAIEQTFDINIEYNPPTMSITSMTAFATPRCTTGS